MNRTLLALLAAPLVVAALAPPASADIKATPVQSANMQAEKGLQLDSRNVQKVYCDLKTTGFSSVTFNPTLVQDTPTSTVIKPRQKKGVEPTPTDAQLRQAIRNAKACGLKVILKPHLELADSSWRAKIKGSAKEHKAWRAWLVYFAKVAKDEGVEALVIGVEQKGMSLPKNSTAEWLKTIDVLRKTAPKVKLTYAAHANDELLLLNAKWVKRLDYISATYYPRPPSGKLTVKTLEADIRKDKPVFDKAHKRYGKRLVFAETGFRSIDYKHRFARKPDEYKGATKDEGLQAMQYEALLHFLNGLSYVDGVMLYRSLNSQDAGKSPTDLSFTWQNKEAEVVVAKYMGGRVPTR